MATRALLVIIAATVIISVLPRNERSQIHFDVGKPWMQSAVIAKFQFPVYKSDEAIAAERDSIVNNFSPYYRIDTSIEKRSLDDFASMFGTEFIAAGGRIQICHHTRASQDIRGGCHGTNGICPTGC